MPYRKAVYHKNYKPTDHEKIRGDFVKVVNSQAELDDLGPDWGDHPGSVDTPLEAALTHVTETDYEDLPKAKRKKKSE